MHASSAPIVFQASKQQARARRALVILLRRMLAGRWGIRAARIYAVAVSIGVTATIWVLAARYGPDETVISLVARAAAFLTWIAGGIGALALSAPPKDVAQAQGIASLARAHGQSDEAIAQAEMIATVRLLVEVVAVPVALVGLFVLAFFARGEPFDVLRPIAGAVLFALLASIVLGVVASGCRRWGGKEGRSWLLVVVLLPWLLAELGGGGRTASYLSIPGLLGRIWETLTAVSR